MKTYFVLIRELDGRTIVPPVDENRQHQLDMKSWIDKLVANGQWVGGKPLTLTGKVLRPEATGLQITDGAYRVNELEIVGGYMLINANDLDEAVALIKTCPVFDSDGFVEIREVM